MQKNSKSQKIRFKSKKSYLNQKKSDFILFFLLKIMIFPTL